VSACVLARTNAYGVHVNISMRAPANAPQAIKDALAVTDVERNGIDGAGTGAYSLREGAYYGNIFATTPVDLSGNVITTPPATTATYTVANTPTFRACAGPGSNIPEITKRFCSSQGDQVVIGVPGVCLTNPGGELGTCSAEDQDPNSPTFGAVQDCYTEATTKDAAGNAQNNGTHYAEVITVYLQEPIAVCGNAVCEPPSETATSCPSDCHPATWGKDLPFLGGSFDQNASNYGFVSSELSAVSPLDDTIVVAGTINSSLYSGGISLGGGTFQANQGMAVVAKYKPDDGSYVWSEQFGGSTAIVAGVAVAPDGNVIVVGWTVGYVSNVQVQEILIATFAAADGTPLGTWTLPIGSLSTLPTLTPTRALAVDSQGNIAMAGMYTGTATFGSTTFTSAGFNGTYSNDTSIYLAKVSLPAADAGATPPTVTWAQSLGGVGVDFPLSLAFDPSDDVVLLTHEGLSSGNKVVTLHRLCSDGSSDPAQPCADGSAPWTKTAGANATYTVATADATGNIYAGGYFGYGHDFGAGVVANNFGLPPFIEKYAKDGSFLWASYARTVCPTFRPNCSSDSVDAVAIAFGPGGTDAAGGVVPGDVILASYGDPIPGGGLDFGTGTLPTYDANNVFLAAYSPDDGGLRWTKQIPMILPNSALLGFALDSKGRVIVSGTYSGSMQVDDRLLVTGVPEQVSTVDSFLAAFVPPSLLDTTPPDIGAGPVDPAGSPIDTVPGHIVAEATSAAGAVVFYMPPTAIDSGNAGTSVVCSPSPNTTFPIGTTTVTCTASDPIGNQSTATFTVTVTDTLPPLLSTAADVTVQASNANGATVPYAPPAATDQVDRSPQVTCAPASGSTFPVGKTTITCTATDFSHNQSQTAFRVTVRPPPFVPPMVSCVGSPGSPSVVPTPPGVCGVAVNNGSSAAGACTGGGGGLASCTFNGHVSETLGPGSYAIAVAGTAVDGSTASCTSYVQVVDSESPTIQCHAQTAQCTGQGSATAAGSATCTDNCSCTASCMAAVFPLGTSQDTCTASDPSGNKASCYATIEVVDTIAPLVAPRPGPAQLQCGVDTWTDPGATAIDACAGDLSSSVHAAGIVDPMHLGSYSVTYTAADPSGNVGTAARSVSVVDTLPPQVTLTASPSLWPPNQTFVAFDVSQALSSIVTRCYGSLSADASARIVSIYSDENDPGAIVITSATTFQVAQSRNGSGNGRVYGVTLDVRDASGNVTRVLWKVTVPHDQSGAPAVDDGPSAGFTAVSPF
jgi:hypothetical protein